MRNDLLRVFFLFDFKSVERVGGRIRKCLNSSGTLEIKDKFEFLKIRYKIIFYRVKLVNI